MKQEFSEFCKRFQEVLLTPKRGFQNLLSRPVHWSIVTILGCLMFILNAWMLLNVPSFLSWIFVHDLVTNEFFLIGLPIYFTIVSIYYFIVLGSIFLANFIRRKIEKVPKRPLERTKLLNIYAFSLLPYILFLSQIPFALTFGGYYNLFGLLPFYIIIWIGISAWHLFLFFTAVRQIRPLKTTIIVVACYFVAIIGILIFWTWFVNFSNWSITMIGYFFA
ncbi:MAG: hypothetical protein ACTSRW_14875 [Candidatus Helarchaeota archaeon]